MNLMPGQCVWYAVIIPSNPDHVSVEELLTCFDGLSLLAGAPTYTLKNMEQKQRHGFDRGGIPFR